MSQAKTTSSGDAIGIKKNGERPEVYKIPKPHPFPKIKRSSKAEIERQLAEYEKLVEVMRAATVNAKKIDAVQLVRQQRDKGC